jgi:predicted nucleotidyltransferase
MLFESKCRAIVGDIVAMVAPRKVILFGSIAKGAPRPKDIDLLIVMPNGARCREVAQKLYRDVPRHGMAIDLVVITEQDLTDQADAPWSVICHALKDGKVLYAA